MQIHHHVILLGILLPAASLSAASKEFCDAVKAVLRDHIDLDAGSVGMVVGVVDEHGPSVISHGSSAAQVPM